MSSTTEGRATWSPATAAGRDTCRVILWRRSGSELLVFRWDSGLALPAVDIPRNARVAESVNEELQRRMGIAGYCLFCLPLEADPQPSFCEVAASRDDDQAIPACYVWLPVSTPSRDLFAQKDDFSLVLAAAEKTRSYQTGAAFGPFGRPGWIDELLSWAQDEITALGLILTGEFRQLSASPACALVRLETNGPAIWFKAVGEPNHREFPITVAVSQFLPKFVPPLLATRPPWSGWLAREVEGGNLKDTRDPQRWAAAAAALAQCQVESIGNSGQFLSSGARDLRTPALARVLSPLLDHVSLLMKEQNKIPPPVLRRDEVLLLKQHIEEALCLLEESRIPDALGHLDLNPGNIIVSPAGCVFLDWAEAYVGNPFFSFQYLLEHFRRVVGIEPVSEAQLGAAYSAGWRTILPPEDIAKALKVLPLLAVFAYAAGSSTWADPANRRQPNAAGYLRSLARRMNREATQLAMRSLPCPN